MDHKEALEQLQTLESSMQTLSAQKQQFTIQQAEIEVALAEIEKTPQAYKILGNIMIAADKATLKTDLESKRETTKVRIESLERQEARLKQHAEELQSQIMGDLLKAQKGQEAQERDAQQKDAAARSKKPAT